MGPKIEFDVHFGNVSVSTDDVMKKKPKKRLLELFLFFLVKKQTKRTVTTETGANCAKLFKTD